MILNACYGRTWLRVINLFHPAAQNLPDVSDVADVSEADSSSLGVYACATRHYPITPAGYLSSQISICLIEKLGTTMHWAFKFPMSCSICFLYMTLHGYN